MSLRKFGPYSILATLFFVVLSFIVYRVYFDSYRIYSVNNAKLFENFLMTKEIKRYGEAQLVSQNKIIDSLNIVMSLASDPKVKQEVFQYILDQKETIKLSNENFNNEETVKIWSRINSYVQDFAKEKECDIILGSQYNGDILYAKDEHDITSELLSYINKRYEGFQ